MPKPTPSSGSSAAKLLSNAIKYGPVIVEGVRRYGPVVRDQIVENKDTIAGVVGQRPRKGEARRNALAHAASVVDGSTMQVFHQAQEHWVVFSGQTPIGVHPFTSVPYGELLRHADLSRRIRPQDSAARGVVGRLAQRIAPAPRPAAPRPQQPGQARPGAATPPPPRREEPIEGEII